MPPSSPEGLQYERWVGVVPLFSSRLVAVRCFPSRGAWIYPDLVDTWIRQCGAVRAPVRTPPDCDILTRRGDADGCTSNR